MWNKSARLLMVRVKVKKRRGFSFLVPIWVIDEFMEAFTNLAWVGEKVIGCVPLPRDENVRKNLSWVKSIPPSGVIASTHRIIKDLSQHKGLDLVDVETEEVQVKIRIK
ncbi:hypothetical protein E4K67_06260 [Desulfosporosinus fructosivorans]|uniref:Uncharacterized protein n=1 Tax=Desulfosporosinus fructosivorans TaxID=2018669 RepID=A0A4Z0RAB3_9FIRM|nr:hypothetical protein [Desulfosporosinus fructosivorans]TGE39067.1 hypothetical protein E4K67_06260 [Desulfosporosinus fructosivorans]